jgi:hypothetical protein
MKKEAKDAGEIFGKYTDSEIENNEELKADLESYFYVSKEQPLKEDLVIEDLPNIGTLEENRNQKSKKNILTGLVRKADNDYAKFMDHEAKSYVMERIPNINLMGIQYFLPMVAGSIDGYYEVERIGFITSNNLPALRLRLGRYIPIGENMVDIYKTKMQPGELISYDYTMKMYNGEI